LWHDLGSGRDEAVVRALRAESEHRWQERRRRRALVAQVALCVVVPALYIAAGVGLTIRRTPAPPPRATVPVAPQTQPLITSLPAPLCPNADGLEDDVRVEAVTRELRSLRAAAGRAAPHERPAKRSPLANNDITRGIANIRSGFTRCGNAAPSSRGLVWVTAVIAPSGFVTRARATGDFAGTAVGRCLAAAVATAEFPLSNHSVTTEFPIALLPEPAAFGCPATITQARLLRERLRPAIIVRQH